MGLLEDFKRSVLSAPKKSIKKISFETAKNIYENEFKFYEKKLNEDKNRLKEYNLISFIDKQLKGYDEESSRISPDTYVVIKPFNNFEELNNLIRTINFMYKDKNRIESYELGFMYLIKPDKWKGPLNVNGVIAFKDDQLKLTLYYVDKKKLIKNSDLSKIKVESWTFNKDSDIEKILKRIGLIDGDGLTVIIKGSPSCVVFPGKFGEFQGDFLYFGAHYHCSGRHDLSNGDKETFVDNIIKHDAEHVIDFDF